MTPKNIDVIGVRNTPIAKKGETVTVLETKRIKELIGAGYLRIPVEGTPATDEDNNTDE